MEVKSIYLAPLFCTSLLRTGFCFFKKPRKRGKGGKTGKADKSTREREKRRKPQPDFCRNMAKAHSTQPECRLSFS